MHPKPQILLPSNDAWSPPSSKDDDAIDPDVQELCDALPDLAICRGLPIGYSRTLLATQGCYESLSRVEVTPSHVCEAAVEPQHVHVLRDG